MRSTRLNAVADINAGVVPESMPPDEEIRYADLAAVDLQMQHVSPRLLRFEDAPSRARRRARPGDSLVPYLTGGADWLLTRPLLLQPAHADVVFSTGFYTASPRGIDPRFLNYVLASSPTLSYLEAHSSGVTMKGFSQETFAKVTVPFPSPASQAAVANFLDGVTSRIDALITRKGSLNDLLEERLDSLVEELVWRRPDSADRWDAVPLRRVTTRVDVGIAEAASHAYVDEGVPLVRSTNIRPNIIETEGMLFLDPEYAATQQRKVVRAGDILTVRTGATGVSAVVPDFLDGCQTFTQLVSTVRPPNLSEFVAYALNSLSGREYFELLRWGSAQDNISVPTLAACPVPFATASAQEEVVRKIREARTVFGALRLRIERQLRLLQEHRQGLITAAVTGELEVTGVAA